MSEQAARKQEAPKEPVRPHQPGQEVFKAILSEEIEWKPYPGYPASVHSAVVVGQPSEKGPYTIRGQGTPRREIDATPASGRSGIHSDFRRVLHRLG